MASYVSRSVTVAGQTATLLVDTTDFDREIVLTFADSANLWRVGFTSTEVVNGARPFAVGTGIVRLILPAGEQFYVYVNNDNPQVIDYVVTKAPIT